MMTWHYSGSGNAMVIIDCRQHSAKLSPRVIEALCDRHVLGLPLAEGVLAVREVQHSLIVADFYNPDGSTGPMCGNGGRTLAAWMVDSGLEQPSTQLTLNVSGIRYPAHCPLPNQAEIVFPTPTATEKYPAGTLDGVPYDVWYVDVGSDHAVVFDVSESFDPRVLRHHAAFPRGVNVNMARITSPSAITLTTFERGVERVTGACGTGAISTAVVALLNGSATSPVTITPPSGQQLIVAQTSHPAGGNGFSLCGPTTIDHAPVEFSLDSLFYVV